MKYFLQWSLWLTARLVVAGLFMLVTVVVAAFVNGIVYGVSGRELGWSDNSLVAAFILLASIGSFFIGYCPRCKWKLTTRVITNVWDRTNDKFPICPKCDSTRLY